ncbi:MAG: response regulator [Betaproteobacteria bacterium]|nr:response regulator [Betaproteobacteria bacterium]
MSDILIVDDELGVRELLLEVLEDEGHSVALAANAAQARQVCQAKRFDLVLLDIWMPDTDGVTLLKEWSGQGLLTMPVVMMSGHATIETAIEATRIGAFDFLEKPIALARLLKTVQAALARAQAQKAWQQALANAQPFAAASSDEDDLPNPKERAQEALLAISLEQPLREARDAFERIYLEYQLAKQNGSMTRLAEQSGLERTHLYRKIKQLGMEPTRAVTRKTPA